MKKLFKKGAAGSALTAVFLGAFYAATVMTASADNGSPGYGEVGICHATGSTSNPFVYIHPDASGVYAGHVGADHQDGRDIIPPFTFKTAQGATVSFPGQNMDKVIYGVVGSLWLANKCEQPRTTTTGTTGGTTTVIVTVTGPVTTVTGPTQTVTGPTITVTGPTVTNTQTVTTTQTVTVAGQTVTAPPVTTTVQLPGTTATVTTPAQTVTGPTQTVTTPAKTLIKTVTKTRTVRKIIPCKKRGVKPPPKKNAYTP